MPPSLLRTRGPAHCASTTNERASRSTAWLKLSSGSRSSSRAAASVGLPPRRRRVSLPASSATGAPTTPPTPNSQPPTSQPGPPIDLQQLCADYDVANPAPLPIRSRHVAKRIKALSGGDPWAYDIFRQDGRAFVEGAISAPELRDRFASIFGRSGDAEVAFLEMAMAVPQLHKRCQLLRTAPLGVLQAFRARVSGGMEAALAARRERRDQLLAAWEAGEIDGEEALRLGLAELDDEDDEAWGRVAVEAPSGPAWNDPFTEQDIAETDPQLRSTYLIGWQSLDREKISAQVQDLLHQEEADRPQRSPEAEPPSSSSTRGDGGSEPAPASSSGELPGGGPGKVDGAGARTVADEAGVLWDPAGAALAGEGVHLNSLSSIPARKLPSKNRARPSS